MSNRQGVYWILTIPHHQFCPYLPPGINWIKGQLELAASGFLHWQIIIGFCKKASLRVVRSVFGPSHAELTRSVKAEDYVWKEETVVEGTRFELGRKPHKQNSIVDWDKIWDDAKGGDLLSIPAGVRFRSYSTIRRIASDFAKPVGMLRTCYVFWGRTATGKSMRAWEEAGMDAFAKDPRTKWWDGYSSEKNVVIDEFRGSIDVSHLLRWLDRYPVRVEIKGCSLPFCAEKIWITSNVDPRLWYCELDVETLNALLRRLNITHFP